MTTEVSQELIVLDKGSRFIKAADRINYRVAGLLVALVLLVLALAPVQAQAGAIPTISITSVTPNQSVSLMTYNFPPNQDFTVTMGPMGSLGINGYQMGTVNSGAGGSFALTYPIPDPFLDSCQVAIRLQSPQGYYAYNWFYNTCNSPGTPPETVPTFSIVSVNRDQDVTIQTSNFPEGQTFTVTMGEMGTLGIGGYVVGTITEAGSFQQTFNIPPELYGRYQISMRAQTAHANPYYAYNWFYNNTTGGDTGGTGGMYVGIPTFSIESVVRDQTVTIKTNNFPANQEFTVTMGEMGTLGIGGYVVGTIDTATTGPGAFEQEFTIPPELYGRYQISIRAQTAHQYPYNPYYAYNWFYNNTTGGTGGEPTPTPQPPSTPDYSGIPTFTVCGVSRNNTVTIVPDNFPEGQQFNVTMGPMGALGYGESVGSIDTTSGTQPSYTFTVPSSLHDHYQISIRAQTAHAYPYYAFNWFYNNDATITTGKCAQ